MLVNLFDNKARSQEQKTDEKASHYKDCDETGLVVGRQIIGAIIKDRKNKCPGANRPANGALSSA
jgi:hypothetical protein